MHGITRSRHDVDLLEAMAQAEARRSFWTYRRYMNPGMFVDWWPREIALELHRFWLDYKAGRRPKLLINSPPQHGKQIEDATPVLTTNGWKNHGDLVVGDMVFHPSGLPTRVTAVSAKTCSDHCVELNNGEVFWCHARHEWTVYNRNKKQWQTLETQQMMNWQSRDYRTKGRSAFYTGVVGKRGSRYSYSLPLVSPLIGVEKQLPVHPYVLGVWLGDGRSTGTAITYHQADAVIISSLQACGARIGATYGNKQYAAVLTTGLLGLTQQLRAAGVLAPSIGIRSKHIPEVYLTASLRQRLELLAGLIDTDGYIYSKNGRVVFVTGDQRLKDTFCALLATFGWHASVNTVAPSLSSSGIQGRKDCYYIGFQPTIAIPCRIPRKQIHVNAVRRRVAIKSITAHTASTRIGHCITVDAPDGLYLVGKTLQPTHNSVSVVDFLSWIAGQDRDLKIIFASFSDRLGARANLRLQRLFGHPKFIKTFGDRPILKGGGMLQNSKIVEFADGDGYFRNTTVRGAVTGEALDIGVIDDPIKGRAEASSQLVRDTTWDWYTDDFMPRFADHGAMLMIMTRYHVDDPAGRLLERNFGVRVLRYTALAEQDEQHCDLAGKSMLRRAGEPLFPALKSKAFLEKQRSVMSQAGWESIYQQSPIIVGGGLFPIEKIEVLSQVASSDIKRSVRAWDKAGTFQGGAYTAGVLMHAMKDGSFVIGHVARGQWGALEREDKIKFWAKSDKEALKSPYEIVVEQEPGSGGLESVQATIRNLAGFKVYADKVRGSKELRAEPLAAQVQGGNVKLLNGDFRFNLLDEMSSFPNGKYRDQCDACSSAFNRLTSGPVYNIGALG